MFMVYVTDPAFGTTKAYLTFDEVVFQDTHGQPLGATKTCTGPIVVKNGLVVSC
jgi:hypothetical protein